MMAHSRVQSNLDFRLMAIEFLLRDWLRPPINVLREAGMLPGMTVLDFGCGPGGFSLAAARLVEARGRVYALDIHPLAIRMVKRDAEKQGLRNIHPIHGTSAEVIPDESVNFVLLYDVLHDLPDTDSVLREIHRVLTPDGILSASDHHLQAAGLQRVITETGLFLPTGRTQRTHQFARAGAREGAV